jgi:hypothetical protein
MSVSSVPYSALVPAPQVMEEGVSEKTTNYIFAHNVIISLPGLSSVEAGSCCCRPTLSLSYHSPNARTENLEIDSFEHRDEIMKAIAKNLSS